MKKIRLSERELTNIIKRVIDEGVTFSQAIDVTDHNGGKFTINLPDSSGNPGKFVYGNVTYNVTKA